MMDLLNRLFELNVSYSRTQEKYIQNIIDKMNEKFKKIILPITLVIENLNIKNNLFKDQQKVLIKMKNELFRMKMIVIEKTDQSSLDLWINYKPLKINNFDWNDYSINGGREKINAIF